MGLSAAAQSTAFTYQGRLDSGGTAAGGIYDLRFAIYDSGSGGTSVAGPLTNSATAVSNGLFTVTLDFGPGVFTGAERWLEIGVRSNNVGTFIPLDPRQNISAAPYAIRATQAATVDQGIVSNPLFLGTTTGLPLELFVNNQRALRLEDNGDGSDINLLPDGAPNLIGGSPANTIGAGVVGATIGGGGATNYGGSANPNTILADYATIAGGLSNRIESSARAASILGGQNNRIDRTATFSLIGGGLLNHIGTNAGSSVIAGGWGNWIEDETTLSVIGGGWANRLGSAQYSVIGGGWNNVVTGHVHGATIAGGWWNKLGSNAASAVISGGQQNEIGAAAKATVIAGGEGHQLGANTDYSAIGGGYRNTIMADARVNTIAGGNGNYVWSNALYGVVGGGTFNNILEGARYATIPGGYFNAATNYGFAAGRQARAYHTGAFVWSDSADADFESTADNQFNVRAGGGVRFITGGAGMRVDGLPVLAGTVPTGGLTGNYSNAVAFTSAGNSFSGNGSALTSLNASQLTSGTVADARLSANVALRNTTQTFTANNIFSANLGVGVSPTTRLDVNGQVRIRGGSPGAGKVLTSDANGIAVWSASKASPQIVVVDAAGNGDYASVSAALTAITPTASSPYVIEVRPGLYFDRILMKSHVQLKGAGAGATVILFNNAGAGGNADLAVVKLNNLTNVAVSGLTLTTRAYTNAALNEACVGIYDIASSPVVTACRFVSLEGNRPVVAFDIDVFGVASSGSSPVIRDCHFESGLANDAISLFQSGGLISDNVFSNHWHALYLEQSTAQFVHNRLGEVGEAVYVNPTSEATVGFNQFAGTGSGATAIVNAGEARIIGNDISGTHEVGIDNQGAAAILGNTLSGCTETGIRDTGSTRTTISGNLLLNCSGSGEPALVLINSSAIVTGNAFGSNAFGDIRVAGSGTPIINNNRSPGTVSGAASIAGFGAATVSANPTNLFLNATSGVGIGETAPEGQLHITGNPATPQIKIETTSNNSFVKLRLESFGKPYWDFAVGGTANVMNWFYSGSSQNLMSLATNGTLTTVGTVNPPSDRNVKQDFAAVDARAVLEKVTALPIQSWAYKNSPDTRHIGPVAQDFHAAFQFNGDDDKHITTVDADGVALAAIQGLNQKLEAELKRRDAENLELKSRLERLEQLLSQSASH